MALACGQKNNNQIGFSQTDNGENKKKGGT